MKKTVLVIYTNEVRKEKRDDKRYCFLTEADVLEGDLLKSVNYTTNMLVVKVVDKGFIYYNPSTGEMSDELTSTIQREIKTMRIVEKEEDNLVIATKIN